MIMHKQDSRSRKEKAFETKNHLYAVADKLFTQYGFDDVSVDKIVEEAGLSKGTFYVHFESKDSLLAALISEYVDKVDVDYQKFIEAFSFETPAADILLRLIDNIVDVIVDTIGLERMKALYRTQLTNISYTGTSASYNRKLYTTITDVLTKGIQRGEFVTVLPLGELANHMILAMRGLTYEWCIRYPDFDLKAQSRVHFMMILQGIMRR
jgi:AcrR family transcriptional regulator